MPVEISDADGDAAPLIAPDGVTGAVGQWTVVLDHPFQRFPGQIKAVEVRITVFEEGHDPQRLRVVVEAAIWTEAEVQRPFAGVAERRMAEIMRQRQRLRQVLAEP